MQPRMGSSRYPMSDLLGLRTSTRPGWEELPAWSVCVVMTSYLSQVTQTPTQRNIPRTFVPASALLTQTMLPGGGDGFRSRGADENEAEGAAEAEEEGKGVGVKGEEGAETDAEAAAGSEGEGEDEGEGESEDVEQSSTWNATSTLSELPLLASTPSHFPTPTPSTTSTTTSKCRSSRRGRVLPALASSLPGDFSSQSTTRARGRATHTLGATHLQKQEGVTGG